MSNHRYDESFPPEEVNPYSKIPQTTVYGAVLGALVAANQTYPKTPFVTNAGTNVFYRSTMSLFGKHMLVGSVLGFSYSTGKYAAQSIRGKDDYMNIAAGSLAAALSIGVYKSNVKLTIGASLLFAPFAIGYKLANDQIEESGRLNHDRIRTEKRTELFIQEKLKQLDAEDEAMNNVL
eukprot:gene14389-16981_t